MHSFLHRLSTENHVGVQYSSDGSRLLCAESSAIRQSVKVYDLLPNKKLDGNDKVSLPSPTPLSSIFAEKEDELVVSSIANRHLLLIWQLPSAGSGQRTVESPVLELNDGHLKKNVFWLQFQQEHRHFGIRR